MLTFNLPEGFVDATTYRFGSRKRRREYWLTRVPGSAAAEFQQRRLLQKLGCVAEKLARNGHRVKLGFGKDDSLLLQVIPKRCDHLNKQQRPVKYAMRAAVKCLPPGVAVRLLAVGLKDDAKEFAAVWRNLRRVAESDAARIRIEEPADRPRKWRPAGTVEVKLPVGYQMHVPMPWLERAGEPLVFTRTPKLAEATITTNDWPLCDKVGSDWEFPVGINYYEIDEGSPGIAAATGLAATSAGERAEPGDDALHLFHSAFSTEETQMLVDSILASKTN